MKRKGDYMSNINRDNLDEQIKNELKEKYSNVNSDLINIVILLTTSDYSTGVIRTHNDYQTDKEYYENKKNNVENLLIKLMR